MIELRDGWAVPYGAGLLRMLELLAEEYGAVEPRVTPIFEEGDKGVYRVDRAEGGSWVLRRYPAARPLERLQGQVAIMRYVECNGVPAERVVATVRGEDWCVLDGRGVLVTSLIEGTRPRRTATVLGGLGESIGRLHALPSAGTEVPALARRAGAMPREDLAFGRACLERVAGMVPAAYGGEYDALRDTLERTRDCEALPAEAHGLVHSDCHLGNALETRDGEVAWVDWDGAGRGPRVAALGLLLYSCAVQAPDEPREAARGIDLGVIAERVEAVLAGYGRHHRLTKEEIEYLPDAVRFRPAVIAARTLAEAIERGVPVDESGWEARYAEAEGVADCARVVSSRAGVYPR